MAVREILLYPHRALKTVARELVADDAAEVERVTADLLDTMDSFGHCVGLAAPQLGELVRIAVVDVTGHKKATVCNGRLVLVNPRVVSAEGAEVAREGCLSIPDLTANVRRATRDRASSPTVASRSSPRASRHAASCTSSTTSTGCCSSTASTRCPATCSGARTTAARPRSGAGQGG